MFPESNDSVGHEREPKSNARICSALKEVYHAIEPAPFTHAVKKVQPSRDMYTTVPTYVPGDNQVQQQRKSVEFPAKLTIQKMINAAKVNTI